MHTVLSVYNIIDNGIKLKKKKITRYRSFNAGMIPFPPVQTELDAVISMDVICIFLVQQRPFLPIIRFSRRHRISVANTTTRCTCPWRHREIGPSPLRCLTSSNAAQDFEYHQSSDTTRQQRLLKSIPRKHRAHTQSRRQPRAEMYPWVNI